MANTALIPVFSGTLADTTVQLCDARTLHAFMQVLRDFTTWIKARIRKYGFVEGVDYLLTKSGEKLPSGTKYSSDYHLTLDMAKELSMVENNDMGRQARRYFIDCEKAASNTLTIPTRITAAQAQHLKELVQIVVDSGKQGFGETWNRLHRKMKVNSYLELSPARFDEACEYLHGKMDGQSMVNLIEKHYLTALPAAQPVSITQQIESAIQAANAVSAQVQTAIVRAILSGNDNWKHRRWMFSFITDSKHGNPPMVDAIESDAVVASLKDLAAMIECPGGMMPSNEELANLGKACAVRLAVRMGSGSAKALPA